MKKPVSKLRYLFTVQRGENGPIVEQWIGFRNGDDAYIGKDDGRPREKRILRCRPSSTVFDSREAALASLKPVKGWGTKWRGGVLPALVVRMGDGQLRATSNEGKSLGTGYLTKRQAARAALKDALRWEREARQEYRERQAVVAALQKILRAS